MNIFLVERFQMQIDTFITKIEFVGNKQDDLFKNQSDEKSKTILVMYNIFDLKSMICSISYANFLIHNGVVYHEKH